MRNNIITLVTLSLVILNCSENVENNQISNEAIVTGKISNVKSETVKIILDKNIRGLKNEEYLTSIDENGGFRFQLQLDNWTLGKIFLTDSAAYFFLEPADSIHITVDETDFMSSLTFDGKGSANCRYFNESYNTFESRVHLVGNRIKTKEVTTGKGFREYRDNIRDEHLEFYNANRNELSPAALKVALAQINCRWANKIFDYPTVHLFFNDKEMTPDFEEGYHAFIDSLDLNDESLLPFDKYIVYLDNYLDHQLKLKFKYTGLKYDHTNSYDEHYKYPDLYELSNVHLKGKVKFAMQSYYLVSAIERGRFETIENQFKDFKTSCQDDSYLEPVLLAYDKTSLVAKGKPAPDFTLTSYESKKISLSDLRGKVVYLDFWASWCKPCIDLIPDSKELKEIFKNDEVVFLNVSIDENEKAWHRMIEKERITGVNLITYGISSPMANQYGIRALPRYFLIDKKGNIVDTDAKKPNEKELISEIRELIK